MASASPDPVLSSPHSEQQEDDKLDSLARSWLQYRNDGKFSGGFMARGFITRYKGLRRALLPHPSRQAP
jgi:hypothetical protein